MHGTIYAMTADIFLNVQQEVAVLLFGFTSVAILITTRIQGVMSQMKENQLLITFIFCCC